MRNNWKYRIIYVFVILFVCYTNSLGVNERNAKKEEASGNSNLKKSQDSSSEEGKLDQNKATSKGEHRPGRGGESTKRKEEKAKENELTNSKKGKNRKKTKREEERHREPGESKQSKEEEENIALKALFVDQIKEEHQGEFMGLMNDLSVRFEANEWPLIASINDIKDITSCISNYDYYNKKEYPQSSYGKMLLPPSTWVNEKMREDCIKIVNHALDLSGYGKYLKDHKEELTQGYDICCSVNYYYDRTGAVGFHQDSFGRELFVLLIYLNEVDGPEWKLKDKTQFETRMRDIFSKELMPRPFILEAEKLYRHVAASNNGSVQWPGRIKGPGGIVGFVDELMIHSTPYMQNRQPNGELLLQILQDMGKEMLSPNSNELAAAVRALENTIYKIIEKGDNHYISIDELQGIIRKNNELSKVVSSEAITETLNKLYIEEHNKGGDVNLGASNHDIYKSAYTDETEKVYQHTGSRARALSDELRRGNGSTSTKVLSNVPGEKRSFLRVWVTALPKVK